MPCVRPYHLFGISRMTRVGQGGVVVYQYTRKKFPKIAKIHPNIPKINESIVYCIPDISS